MGNLRFIPFFLPIISMLITGCSLSGSNGDAFVSVDLSSLERDRSHLLLLNNGSPLVSLSAPPASATGFKCYAVNVTGPGIFDSSANPNPNHLVEFDETVKDPNRFCNYPGVQTPPILLDGSGGANVSLPVPPGGIRLIQVVGVNDPALCSGSLDQSSGGSLFEVGRAVLLDVFGDRSVGVPMDWPTGTSLSDQQERANRVVDCRGDCSIVSSIAPDVTPGEVAIDNTSKRIAFRLPSVPGKMIRTVGIFIKPLTNISGATVNVTAELFSVNAGADIGDVSASATGYEGVLNLPAAAALTFTEINFRNTNGDFLRTDARDYWVVIKSTDAVLASSYKKIHMGYNFGGDDPGIRQLNSTVWSNLGAASIPAQIIGCN